MMSRIFLLLLAIGSLQFAVDAFPTGAGDCPSRTAAVGGTHLTATTLNDGDLNDFGVELLLNGQSLSSSTPFDVPIGQDHVWELVSTGYRGFLLRLDGGDSVIDTIDALGPLSGMGGMVQVAEVCTSQGVGGVTHRSRQLKNSTIGILRLDEESQGMNLDVTVVVKNANDQSEYYYSSFTLNAVQGANTVPLPSPTSRRPTPAPVAPPTTRRPTMSPIRPSTTRRPTLAPVAQSTAQTPAFLPTESTVTEEETFQGTPTFVPTTSPSFGIIDVAVPTEPFPFLSEPVLEPTFGDEAVWDGAALEPTSSGNALLPEDGPTVEPAEPFLVSVVPSCSVNNTCGICQGDCDSDLDCQGHLACFQRDRWDWTLVPGCQGYGRVGRDYCFDPFEYPTALVSGPQDCTAENPCRKCQGDCDTDDQCADNLECFHRLDAENTTVPGCYGLGYPGRDYCFDRADMVIAEDSDPPVTVAQPVGPAVTQAPSTDGTQESTFEDTDETTSPPEPVACPLDVFECPSGDFVGRVPPYCVFEPCPERPGKCTQDVLECPNGGFVGRDPENSCAFFDCPIVDSPTEELLPFSENGCTISQKCGLCGGDCENDAQCEDDLECFNRRIYDLTPVPGCVGDGTPGYGYCYKPDPQSLRARSVPCTPETPCLKCQGDCDSDADCQGNLRCFVRMLEEEDYVPGCTGDVQGNIDYCYDPADDTGALGGGLRNRQLRKVVG